MTLSSKPTTGDNFGFICESEELMRTACRGERFYKEHQGKRYCVFHYPSADKHAEFKIAIQKKLDSLDYNFWGYWFPDGAYFEGIQFEGEVNFRESVFYSGATFRSATFHTKSNFNGLVFHGRADFNSTVFINDADFSSVRFRKAANFSSAVFDAEAGFNSAKFEAEAHFVSARVAGRTGFYSTEFHAAADFASASFGGKVKFARAFFGGDVDFSEATFAGETTFAGARFKKTLDFSYSGFHSYLIFSGDDYRELLAESLTLLNAQIEKAEHVSFNNVALRPHWFIGVKSRQFDFTNILWLIPTDNDAIKSTQRGGGTSEVERPTMRAAPGGKAALLRRLLAKAYRDIAINLEESHHYDAASRFRYRAMDAQRIDAGHRFTFWKLDWLYWAASGYGERVTRAVVMLLILWFGFALIYSSVRCVPLAAPVEEVCLGWEEKPSSPGLLNSLPRSLAYTLATMTLQKPEPRPTSAASQMLVTLCAILGPLQGALLALAIRRKFMR